MAEEVWFDNEAGQFILYPEEGKLSATLVIQNVDPPDDETDKIAVELENLRYLGGSEQYDSDTDKYHKYSFGAKYKLEIFLANRPNNIQFGGLTIGVEGLYITRIPDLENTFIFFTELYNTLQAEVARQEALRAAARARGRNVAALQQTFAGRTGPNVLGAPGPSNVVASFLSGEAGNIAAQIAATKKKAGVARRRKTRRRRN